MYELWNLANRAQMGNLGALAAFSKVDCYSLPTAVPFVVSNCFPIPIPTRTRTRTRHRCREYE